MTGKDDISQASVDSYAIKKDNITEKCPILSNHNFVLYEKHMCQYRLKS